MTMSRLISVDQVGDGLGNQTINASSDDGIQLEKPYDRFEILAEYYPVAFEMNRVLPLILYPMGFVGNLLSAVVWVHCRLRKLNSSATYLAFFAVNDLLYLSLHCITHLDKLLNLHVAKRLLFCELFFCVFFFSQYMTAFLVLGFTAERFVAVCYPLYWRLLCRSTMEIRAISMMTFLSVLLSSIHPLFWTYSVGAQFCGLRRTIPGLEFFWFIWSTITEIVFFFLVPLVVLILDVLVIRVLCQIQSNSVISGRKPVAVQLDHETGQRRSFERPKAEAGKESDESARVGGKEGETAARSSLEIHFSATTVMLLVVSICEIVTALTDSIIYLLHDNYPVGDQRLSKDEMLNDPTWQSHYRYLAAKCIILPITLSRHAILVLLYAMMGPRFRETLRDIIACRKVAKTEDLTRNTPAGSSGVSACYQKESTMSV